MPLIAYIVSLGHSGSTLVDMMIAAHSRAFSIGEVKSLRRYARLTKHKTKHEFKTNLRGNKCTCGAETIWSCPFWSQVNEIVQREAGLTLAKLDINASDPATFRQHNRLLFSAVGSVSGADIIVDSSKDPVRLAGLLATPGLDVLPIHLVREGRGQVASVLRDYPPTPWIEAAARYVWTTYKIQRALGSSRRVPIRYGELVKNPQEVMSAVMSALGARFEAGQLDWTKSVHHNLGGNEKVLLATESRLRHDTGWKQRFSPMKAFGVHVATMPAELINWLGNTRAPRLTPGPSAEVQTQRVGP